MLPGLYEGVGAVDIGGRVVVVCPAVATLDRGFRGWSGLEPFSPAVVGRSDEVDFGATTMAIGGIRRTGKVSTLTCRRSSTCGTMADMELELLAELLLTYDRLPPRGSGAKLTWRVCDALERSLYSKSRLLMAIAPLDDGLLGFAADFSCLTWPNNLNGGTD